MQILPGSNLEWGICIFTLWFCWWKYGWNMEFMKGVRQMYKKVESIIFTPQSSLSRTKTSTSVPLPLQPSKEVDSWEVKHFKNITTIATTFHPRTKRKSGDNIGRRTIHSVLDRFVEDEVSRSSLSTCFVCQHPNKEVVLEEIKKNVPLKNCLDCGDPADPCSPWYIRVFPKFFYWWRKWYLGNQYHVISVKDTMEDDKLKWAIEETAKQEYKDTTIGSLDALIRKHYRRAESIIRKMRAKQPKHPWYALYVRIASWIIAKFLAQIYPKILVRESQMQKIRDARKTGFPILFLPVHRSHIDYVLISWTLVENDVRSPLVAAGENLNIPIFSLMMKSVGGFFIKRRLEEKAGKKDLVYRTMLESYMRISLAKDNDMEFFIEGGRTRTGKPCLPKGGLLNIVVETLLNNQVKDILVVPVNFSYERLLEGNYIREQLGQPKVNESFASALMALWNSLQPKYGNARVDYGHPFSMKEFIQSYLSMKFPTSIERISSSDSESGDSDDKPLLESSSKDSKDLSPLSHTSQRNVVEALGRHVIHEGVLCFTLTSTNAIAFILLNKYRNGVNIKTLKLEMMELKKDLLLRGHDSGFLDNLDQVIDYAAKILGPTLIRMEDKGTDKYLYPVTDLPNIIELSYYSNCLLPIYAMESIIASSILKTIGSPETLNDKNPIKLRESDIILTCLEYSEIFHYEFILSPPCHAIPLAIKDKIRFFTEQGIFSVVESQIDEKLLIISDHGVLKRLKYFKDLLNPILDSYIASSRVLNRLVDHEAEEKRLQMEMLPEIKCELQGNLLKYGESMALDPIRNFMQLGVRWQILESYKTDLKSSIYYLHDDFNNANAVDQITQRLIKLRV